jgi:PKD repeat protein
MWVDWPGITVAQCVWDFGDGQTEIGLVPTHEFTDPGTYNVRVAVTTDSDSSLACTETQWIYVTADTIDMALKNTEFRDVVCAEVVVSNRVPLKRLVIPFSWSAYPHYTLDSLSFFGTRIEGILNLYQMSYVLEWSAATVMLETFENKQLPAGRGPVARIFLTKPAYPTQEDSPVQLWEYLDYEVEFSTYGGKYSPVLGFHVPPNCCLDRVGDVDQSLGDEPTIADVSALIDALYFSGDVSALGCLTEADINQSGGYPPAPADITIGDVAMLIDYLFITGVSMGLKDCDDALAAPPHWIRSVMSSSSASKSLDGTEIDRARAILEEYIRRTNEQFNLGTDKF